MNKVWNVDAISYFLRKVLVGFQLYDEHNASYKLCHAPTKWYARRKGTDYFPIDQTFGRFFSDAN